MSMGQQRTRDGIAGRNFLALYTRIVSLTEGDPTYLRENGAADTMLSELCDKLFESVEALEKFESKRIASTRIPASVIDARREYDARWRDSVVSVHFRRLDAIFAELDLDFAADLEVPALAPDAELRAQVKAEYHLAKEEGDALARAIEYVDNRIACDDDGDFDWAIEAIDAWAKLTQGCGLVTRDALWRRAMLPHILVPTHVSDRYGENELVAIDKRLQQAAQAYVFGAHLAALALLRAVLEDVLRRHYRAPGNDLKEIICSARLPNGMWPEELHRIRNAANWALHGNSNEYSTGRLDGIIIRAFRSLRTLIEQTPRQGRP